MSSLAVELKSGYIVIRDNYMKIKLRLSQKSKSFAVVVLLFSALFTFGGLGMLLEAFETNDMEDIASAIVTIGFFGMATFIVLRRLMLPNGFIEIRHDGILLACYGLGPFSGPLGPYYVTGLVQWTNLSKVQEKKAQFVKCLAISLGGVSSFLLTKETLIQQNAELGEFFARVMKFSTSLIPVGKFIEPILKLFGYSGLPASTSENDIMLWNQKNYGFHILIPEFILPGGVTNLIKQIEEQKAQYVVQSPSASAERQHEDRVPKSTKDRVTEIENLFKSGLISEQEYKRKREQIISEI
jgi:hypothetical protein